MELRPGYKQTEVGVIPDEWDVKPLGETVDFLDGRRRPVKDRDRAKMRGEIPYYGASGIVDYVNDFIFNEDLILLGEDGENILSRNCPLAFKVSGKVWVNNHAHVLRPRADTNIGFLTEFLENLDYAQYNTGTAQPKLNKQVCSTIPVAFPNSAEQRAIAGALGDVDALLGALTKLIAKKRDLKEAAMQQLLTGQTRLPGFESAQSGFKETELGRLPVDWSVIEVKEVTRNHKQGYYTKERYVDAGVKLVRITDLLNPRIDYAAMPMLQLPPRDHDLYRIRGGDFLVDRSGAIGRYGIVYEEEDAVFGSYIIRFSFDSVRLKNEYFGYLYETEIVWKQLLSITQGSSNININASNIKSIRIPLPQLAEQTAIAAVLSDMDAEIAALERRLAKTRALKQGMMQELLTGKTRLI